MSFLEYLEKDCSGDDAHDGYIERYKKPLLERCGKCAEIYAEHLKDLELYRKALDHASTCPLIAQVRVIMVGEYEKLTACDGCRDALLLLEKGLK